MKFVEKIKRFCDKHFKPHCPKCNGVMDNISCNTEADRQVYECRDCGKRLFNNLTK